MCAFDSSRIALSGSSRAVVRSAYLILLLLFFFFCDAVTSIFLFIPQLHVKQTNKEKREEKKKSVFSAALRTLQRLALSFLKPPYSCFLFFFSVVLFAMYFFFLLLIMYAKQLEEERERKKKKNRNEEVVVVSELGTFRMKALLFSFSRCRARRPPTLLHRLAFSFSFSFFFFFQRSRAPSALTSSGTTLVSSTATSQKEKGGLLH